MATHAFTAHRAIIESLAVPAGASWDFAHAEYTASLAEYEAQPQYDEALCDEMLSLRYELAMIPAPDLAALRWKIEMLWKDEDAPARRYIEAVLADVRRLLGGEA